MEIVTRLHLPMVWWCGVIHPPTHPSIILGASLQGACEDLLTEYHPSFLGLTGTPKQIEACARKWRVYYTTPDMIDAQAKDDYLVDHSIITYLVDPPRGGPTCPPLGKSRKLPGNQVTVSRGGAKVGVSLRRQR